jgi:hypothetical protein
MLAFLRSIALLAMIAAIAAPACAVEPAEQFLQGLKNRGLNDVALEYLERAKTSPAVSEDFRKLIPYHRGLVLVEASRQAADPATRDRLMDEARSELGRFAEANPGSVMGAEAQLQLASVQLARGQQIAAQIGQLPDEPAYEAQRRTLGHEARTRLSDAREILEQAERTYSTELGKLPPTTADSKDDAGNRRQEYRARVAQLRFLVAQTKFETAQSYPAAADEFRKLHEEAARELASVYEEFARSFIVGLYARLYEGRCYQSIGSYQQALGSFEDILAQPNVLPPFRKLIASAVHRKAEVLIAQEKNAEAVDVCNACLRDAKADEEEQPEWLAVRFRLADALQKLSDASNAGELGQRKLLAEARDALQFVAKTPGEFQTQARMALASLSGERGSKALQQKEPKTFQAAYDLGKDALASYNAAKLATPTAERNNPEAIPDLQAQMQRGKEDARRYFRAATILVDDDTDQKLVNEVRYFLCWLYWEAQDYYRAAVLGEFLARRYPDHPAAASAAKLSMASFEQLYSQAATDGADKTDTDFEARRMADMAEFVVRRWPGSEDADAAQSVLVSYAIRGGRIEDATNLLAEASPEARPRLELQLGSAMWARFVELSQPGQTKPADESSLNQLKASAMNYLRSGYENARKESQVSDSAAAASLYLVQALLSDEKYDAAIKILEDERLGALTLVKREHAAASRPQYAIETYRAALRAYVSTTPPQEKKALDMMKALDEAVAAGGGNEEQLTQIYVGLGMALEKHAAQLHDTGRSQEAARINTAFAQFLDRIAARQTDTNWPTRAWLAQTYYNMGSAERAGLSTAPVKPLTATARNYLIKARDAFQKLIADAASDPKLAPSANSILAAKIQLGECYRALGQYRLALDTFSAILKEKESMLSVQRAAALTYQERGRVQDAKWLEHAIHGGHKLKSTGQNRIWGWLKLSQVAARAMRIDDKHRDTFYEARVNAARCRYLIAMKRNGAARKQDLFKAKQSIQSLAQLYPDLGGERWRGEFDRILKQIQVAAGEKPEGLREFSAHSTPSGSSQRRGASSMTPGARRPYAINIKAFA